MWRWEKHTLSWLKSTNCTSLESTRCGALEHARCCSIALATSVGIRKFSLPLSGRLTKWRKPRNAMSKAMAACIKNTQLTQLISELRLWLLLLFAAVPCTIAYLYVRTFPVPSLTAGTWCSSWHRWRSVPGLLCVGQNTPSCLPGCLPRA